MTPNRGATEWLATERSAVLYCPMMKLHAKNPPWYVAGLAFECAACGRCCAGPEEGYVWVRPEEVTAMADHLGMVERDFRKKYVRTIGRRQSLIEQKKTRNCAFLADGRCTVYAVRPTQCRTWPFWSSNLETPDDWALAGRRCSGINRGAIYPVADIEAKSRATEE